MKNLLKITFFSFLILIYRQSDAQIINKHLIEYTKSYNPLFGKERSNIKITYDMAINKKDTIFGVLVDIGQTKVKTDGYISSGSFFGNYLGFSTSYSMSLRRTDGFAFLNKPSLDSILTFFDYFISQAKDKKDYNKTISMQIDKINFWVDLAADSEDKTYTKKSFFIQIDESTFKLNEDEFLDLRNNFETIKDSWEYYLKYKNIALPVK